MSLCDQCLTTLTDDDIGDMCTACWREWQHYQESKRDDEGDDE